MSESPDVKALFWQASEIISPEERARFVTEACAGNEALRKKLEELLQAGTEGDFLDRPLFAPPAPEDGVGATFGPYTLVELIAEGGMGTVFRARQATPVERDVAIKVMLPGMDSASVVARFEAERQALAIMDHPGIAKVFDAGVTQKGRPYFVMELVQGVPITRYCDDARMTQGQRLQLFILVCQAIQHAHQKGLIHRDIKPSNVLVTLVDGKPMPKVIDFGIAKAVSQLATEQTLFTRQGVIAGTPQYMSPEQAAPSAAGLDTRSDVYSLGVLLYELLTGSTPLDPETLRVAALAEIVRMIQQVEPPKPSTRLGNSAERLASIAAVRQVEPAKLARTLRGDLDWMVMKALEKEPDRRYDSPLSFARDIQRYLNGDPVEAGPPHASYRMMKFARKHRTALATSAAFVLLLIVTTGISVALALWALKERTRAEGREQLAIDAVKRFRDAVIESPELKNTPSLAPLRKNLLKEPLTFFTSLLGLLQNDHNTRPESLSRLASVANELAILTEEIGVLSDALKAQESSLALRERLVREHPSEADYQRALALNLWDIGRLQHLLGDNERAIVANARAKEMIERLAQAFPAATSYQRDLALAYNNLGAYQDNLGRQDFSLEAYEHGRVIRERLARENPAVWEYQSELAASYLNIGNLQNRMGKPDLAMKSFEQGVDIDERLAKEHPSILSIRHDLAMLLEAMGVMQSATPRHDLALRSFERSLELRKQLAIENPSATSYQANLAATDMNLGTLAVRHG
jgi:serine/threonine protein kinase